MAQRLPTFPDFTWEVRANDRAYHMQFKKRVSFCLTKRKYAVRHLALDPGFLGRGLVLSLPASAQSGTHLAEQCESDWGRADRCSGQETLLVA